MKLSKISRQIKKYITGVFVSGGCRSMGISIHEGEKETPHMTGMVSIGAHTFVEARASLLPETHIGQGCIIGACAVVKGNIPDYSIVVGNPGKIVGDVREWTKKKLQKDW